jgi:hypothetical protein
MTDFLLENLAFSESKTLNDFLNENCFTDDLLEILTTFTTEIGHDSLRRHFGLFWKKFFHGLFLFEDQIKQGRIF